MRNPKLPITTEVQGTNSEDVKPMSLNELHIMIDESKLNYQNGRVTNHEDLKNEVLKWE